VCDAPECKDVPTVIDQTDPFPKEVALMQQNYQQLGITLNISAFETTTAYGKCEDATSKTALCPVEGWFKDFADPLTFTTSLFGSQALTPSCCNDAHVGASSEQLAGWGYTNTTATPSADEQMNACLPLSGQERNTCWVDVDKFLMEQIVPWVPWRTPNFVVITSQRVANFDYDQSAGWVGFDQVSLVNGGK
jgi:hypothetical protein